MKRYRTKIDITTRFKPTAAPFWHEVTIPKGTRVKPVYPEAKLPVDFFVDDLSFIDRNSLTYHDAYYYGIRLSSEQVEGPI